MQRSVRKDARYKIKRCYICETDKIMGKAKMEMRRRRVQKKKPGKPRSCSPAPNALFLSPDMISA